MHRFALLAFVLVADNDQFGGAEPEFRKRFCRPRVGDQHAGLAGEIPRINPHKRQYSAHARVLRSSIWRPVPNGVRPAQVLHDLFPIRPFGDLDVWSSNKGIDHRQFVVVGRQGVKGDKVGMIELAIA